MLVKLAVLVGAAVAAGYLLLAPAGNSGVTGADARQLVADGALLLDVRTPEEFADGHIAGALNIPVDELERRIAEVGPTERPVVVYCRSGRRSALAAATLHSAGYGTVHDLGAMSSW